MCFEMVGKENVDPDLDDFKPTERGRKGSIEPSKRFKSTKRGRHRTIKTI